ncbi:unnamed protein product, partial [Prorocentrum cordatum]
VDFTHASASARSRLDCLYSNFHACEQLDRRLQVAALEWRHGLSHHRAVLASLRSACRSEEGDRPLTNRALMHKDFPRRLMLEFHAQHQTHVETNPLAKDRLYKECMRSVANRLENDNESPPPAVDLEDKLGVALRLIRAIEGARPHAVSSCLIRSPELKDLVNNPYDFHGNLTRSLARLRDYAVGLARDHAFDELRRSRDDLNDPDGQVAHRTRQKNNRLIFRLSPGRTNTIGAVREPSGEATTCPERMATTLSAHWAKVFQARGINSDLLAEWLWEDGAARQAADSTPIDANRLKLKRKHILRALRGRCLKFSASLLHEAAEFVFQSEVQDLPREDIEMLNGSLLFLLPRKQSGVAGEGAAIYEPAANTRPLNVANTDNRLLRNAIRIAIEP